MPMTRRFLMAAAAALAGLGLAGCVTNSPGPAGFQAAVPPPAAAGAVAPNPQVSTLEDAPAGHYGPVAGEPFPVPGIKLAQIDKAYLRTEVAYATTEPPGTIVVDPPHHYLYFVEAGGRAMRYGVGVGREGFAWSGEAVIKSKQEWPDWYPPKEMIERQPELKAKMAQLQSGIGMHGGPGNPLGARAMYLWQGNADTLFRIHGTTEPWTIGKSVSSGCIRMINQDVMDLYQRTPAGTRVVVLGHAKVASNR
ncbi:L,D-transpeptidase [Methyloferula stellata]|uniref:L,D-transpeptidase n=1 Tax=Methyloferula stellata TaxID=876270 RepID=UPI0003795BA5|nr:L,D-transpeptidase [Methyloferula stellata]